MDFSFSGIKSIVLLTILSYYSAYPSEEDMFIKDRKDKERRMKKTDIKKSEAERELWNKRNEFSYFLEGNGDLSGKRDSSS